MTQYILCLFRPSQMPHTPTAGLCAVTQLNVPTLQKFCFPATLNRTAELFPN
jgi:hypothetical protein